MTFFAKSFAIVAVLILSVTGAGAATLQAKVIEVRSGNSLVVSNTNRSVRVRLKAVAPPEAGQPFADAARDHLKALVLDQAVTVDYTHYADGYLEARVILNGVDIGSQMLRDGVAWFDHATDFELNEADRDLYAQCEQAARTEKRGLWQQESPLAPWEFRRIEKAKLDDLNSHRYGSLPKAGNRAGKSVLSSNDLIGAFVGAGSDSGMASGLKPLVQNGSFSRWTSYESPTAHFSIMIPSNGVETSGSAPDKNGIPIAYDIVFAKSDRTFLALFSGQGPTDHLTDSAELDQTFKGFSTSANQQAARFGDLISFKFVRDLKLSGYAGRQYSLTCNAFSGTIRMFTKQMGDQKQVFVLYELSRQGGEGLGGQFFNSFKITQ